MAPILKYLFQREAFIIELDYLEKLTDYNFKEFTKTIRFNIDYFIKYSASDGLLNLNFGIFDKYLDNFNSDVSILTNFLY